MTRFKSDFLNVLTERGYIHQCTDFEALDAKAAKGPLSAYIGFDATADSLHVGSLMQIMILRRLQQTGHRPIVLMGGGTTKVGDPSGKDETRQLMSDEKIASNIAGIKVIFSNFLTFGSGTIEAIMVNNADWLDGLAYIPFLRDVGAHFTINRMLTFDSVKMRLEREQPLTFLEFNYMILQAYDFVELATRHNCVLQMGGSDQWGNIVNGVELGRRVRNVDLYGLTTPLITTSSGAKMGKTAAGAVWLRPERLSAYDYWQFWRNTEDADVVRFLKLFTDMPMAEIAKLEKLDGQEINEAKKILAYQATLLAHGEEAAKQAHETARETFEGSGKGAGLKVYEFPRNLTPAIIDIAVELGITTSKGEAKRMIEQGGVKLNGNAVSEVTATVSSHDMDAEGYARLSFGKKRHALAKAV